MMPTAYMNHPGIHEYRVISPEDIPFSPDVLEACKANACGKYGTCWTCPPGVGELSQLEKKIKSYQTCIVFTCKYDLEDSFDFEGMVQGQQKTKQILREITQRLKESEIPFMALGCEGCGICQECTYPNAPCRFPEKAVPSVEACGIHVVELSRAIGIHYHNGTDTVTYFCMILM